MRTAARIARGRRKKLSSVDKANVLETSRLWREVTERVMTQEFPDVALAHMLVDACAMQLIRKPADFDVIVTENMFGDILTDEASMLAGSMGMLPVGVAGRGQARPLRADSRLGARHRGQGHRQPVRDDPQRCAAAAPLAGARDRGGARSSAAVDAAIDRGVLPGDIAPAGVIAASTGGGRRRGRGSAAALSIIGLAERSAALPKTSAILRLAKLSPAGRGCEPALVYPTSSCGLGISLAHRASRWCLCSLIASRRSESVVPGRRRSRCALLPRRLQLVRRVRSRPPIVGCACPRVSESPPEISLLNRCPCRRIAESVNEGERDGNEAIRRELVVQRDGA